ncbi:hypothetical protein D3C87_1808760 [compost metagenome]
MTEYILIFWRLRRVVDFFLDLPRDLIENTGSVPFRLVLFGRSVTFSFYGQAMQQLGARNVFEIFQYFGEMADIVSINRTEIA